ncbi:MAG: vWA domain-containing protein, partial [Eubacteriales bacterium]|nr:vWA domain-containing protein [Eubacteriales bacterium]
MSKKGKIFRSVLSQFIVLIMTIQLFQGMLVLPVSAEGETEELGQIRGTNPVVLEQEGIGFKKEVKAISKDTFEAKITITGNDVAKPADVVLIFDTSSAVKNSLAKIKEKAKTFASDLMAGNQGGETKFQMGIVAYDDNGRIEQTLSSDLTSIHAAIDALSAKETTGRFIQDGFWKAREILRSSQNQKVMVLLAGDSPNYGYSPNYNNKKEIKVPIYEEGYDIFHQFFYKYGTSSEWRRGFSSTSTSYLIKMNQIGNGVKPYVENYNYLAHELGYLNTNTNIYTIWMDMDESLQHVRWIEGLKYHTQNFHAKSSDNSIAEILKYLRESLFTKSLVSAKLFEPYNRENFNILTKELKLEAHKEGGSNEERAEFLKRVEKINNYKSFYTYNHKSGFFLSNITLGAGESISFNYNFQLHEKNKDGNWYLMNPPMELILNTEQNVKFAHNIELTTKQPKTEIEVFIDWQGGVQPQEENAEVTAYLRQLLNDSHYSYLHQTIPVKLNKDNGWRVVVPDMPLAIDGKRCIYEISTRKGEITLPKDYIVHSTNFRISPDKAKHTFQINLKNIEE